MVGHTDIPAGARAARAPAIIVAALPARTVRSAGGHTRAHGGLTDGSSRARPAGSAAAVRAAFLSGAARNAHALAKGITRGRGLTGAAGAAASIVAALPSRTLWRAGQGTFPAVRVADEACVARATRSAAPVGATLFLPTIRYACVGTDTATADADLVDTLFLPRDTVAVLAAQPGTDTVHTDRAGGTLIVVIAMSVQDVPPTTAVDATVDAQQARGKSQESEFDSSRDQHAPTRVALQRSAANRTRQSASGTNLQAAPSRLSISPRVHPSNLEDIAGVTCCRNSARLLLGNVPKTENRKPFSPSRLPLSRAARRWSRRSPCSRRSPSRRQIHWRRCWRPAR